MRSILTTSLVLLTLLFSAATAQAQINILPEVRAGISARSVDDGSTLLDANRISDANVELLFNAPDLNAWTVLGELRPHVGATFSFRGQDSYGYAGLSWTFRVPVLPVFVEASAGGFARSSLVSAPEGDVSRNFGCGAGLRLAASAGIDLPLGASIIGTVEHLPDFGTCSGTRANTSAGVRLGFRF